jgi:small subunit ribosomal protein S28e
MAEEVKAPQAKAEVKEEQKGSKKYQSKVNVADATPAQVVKVFKKVGIYGECYQVLVRVLGGRDQGNLLRRNVRGPVRENDLLMLKETERDVRAI